MSWTGGAPTFSDPTSNAFHSTFNGDYLQIFQCWGDPQSADPPTRRAGAPALAVRVRGREQLAHLVVPDQGRRLRVLPGPEPRTSWSNYASLSDAPGTYLDTGDNFVIAPFEAVDGTVVDQQADYNYLSNPFKPQPFWLNPYFSYATTNEVDFARTFSNGTGQQLFQVETGLEAPGLGCGQQLQPVGGGTTDPAVLAGRGAPRSTPGRENPANVTNVSSVVTSPLTPEAWANRIAIPLSFNPVGSSCCHQRQCPGRSSAASWPRRPWPAGSPPCATCPARHRSATSRTVTTRPART